MTLAWGFLGASRIGRHVLAPAVALAGHRLVAVAARDRQRALAFAQQFSAKSAYGDYASLLQDAEVDAIYIALMNDAHLPWTIAALQSGRDVLCEKPLALSAAEVARMHDAAQANGRHVMEAFCHLHHPQIDRVRALLGSGAIGTLLALQASMTAALAGDDFRWQAALGGGALFDLGCYCVSLFRYLIEAEPYRVTATQVARRDVDETFSGELRFPNGPVAQFTCSLSAERGQHLVLIGTKGRIALDWPISTRGREVTLAHGTTIERFAAFDPYVPMLHDFANLVAGTGSGVFPLAQSLRQAMVMDALFASARSDGAVVAVEA